MKHKYSKLLVPIVLHKNYQYHQCYYNYIQFYTYPNMIMELGILKINAQNQIWSLSKDI